MYQDCNCVSVLLGKELLQMGLSEVKVAEPGTRKTTSAEGHQYRCFIFSLLLTVNEKHYPFHSSLTQRFICFRPTHIKNCCYLPSREGKKKTVCIIKGCCSHVYSQRWRFPPREQYREVTTLCRPRVV